MAFRCFQFGWSHSSALERTFKMRSTACLGHPESRAHAGYWQTLLDLISLRQLSPGQGELV